MSSTESTMSSSINVPTRLEFEGRLSNEEWNISGLVTLGAPSIDHSSRRFHSHIPIDFIYVVDQSRSMTEEKTILLKQTLFHIIDRLSNLSNGFRRINQK